MAVKTVIELFPKAAVSRAKVEEERKERLKSTAVSSEITEDQTNWILTSKFQIIEAEETEDGG